MRSALERAATKLLGKKVREAVTGEVGVIVSITLDICGCIQGLLATETTKERASSQKWYDIYRLCIIDDVSVMPPEIVELVSQLASGDASSFREPVLADPVDKPTL